VKLKAPALTTQIFIGLALGIFVGWLSPQVGMASSPGADIFLHLIKTIIAPLVFSTLVVGIAGGHGHGDNSLSANSQGAFSVGRVGLKCLIYFELITTFALIVGLVVVNVCQPGAGINLSALNAGEAQELLAKKPSAGDLITHIFPTSIIDSMARGDVLQIVVFTIIFALGVKAARATQIVDLCQSLAEVMFKYTGYPTSGCAPMPACVPPVYTHAETVVGAPGSASNAPRALAASAGSLSVTSPAPSVPSGPTATSSVPMSAMLHPAPLRRASVIRFLRAASTHSPHRTPSTLRARAASGPNPVRTVCGPVCAVLSLEGLSRRSHGGSAYAPLAGSGSTAVHSAITSDGAPPAPPPPPVPDPGTNSKSLTPETRLHAAPAKASAVAPSEVHIDRIRRREDTARWPPLPA